MRKGASFRIRRRGRARANRPRIEAMESRLLLSTFTVINNLDSGTGSLRAAIDQVNADAGDTAASPDTIAFAIPGAGVHTITPSSPLPTLTRPAIIDGYSQQQVGSMASRNTLVVGDNAALKIELNGGNLPGVSNLAGLRIAAGGSGSTIRGLVINRFSSGGEAKAIELLNSNDNTVAGNFLGTNPAGTAALANDQAIVVLGGNNRIGTPAPTDRNLISGNNTGISLTNPTNGTNTLQNNYIGVDASGKAPLVPLGAATNGIIIKGGSLGTPRGATVIGGTTATLGSGAGNVISGNGRVGIEILNRLAVSTVLGPVTIQGNIIGLGADGTTAVGNGTGILFDTDLGTNNDAILIGGPSPAMRNIISSNFNDGILYAGVNTTVQGNFIGTDITGTMKRGNGARGIEVVGRDPSIPAATTLTIGGAAAGLGNLISDNHGGGIAVGTANVVIQGNRIGTQADGISPLGNGGEGIVVLNSAVAASPLQVPIGGTADGAGNVIAYNTFGVLVQNSIVTLLRNSMFGNLREGIFVQSGVVIPAPPAQPVLTGATGTSITGTLSGPAGSSLRLEFFATPNETNQGKTFLGTKDVMIGGTGNASFTFNPPGGVPAGQFLTATATNSKGTSQFSAAIKTPAAGSADLAVTVTDAPDPVAAGGTLTYTITLANKGPGASQNVRLTDTLPAGTTFVSFNAPTGWTVTKPSVGGIGTVTATAPSLANGANLGFRLVVRVASGTPGGTKINDTARVDANTTDPFADNNSNGATTTVSAANPATANLAVKVTGAPKVPLRGKLTYTIKVVNLGPNTAVGVVVTDTLPVGVRVVSAGGGVAGPGNTLIFNRASLANGASATFTVRVQPETAGTIVNTVRAQSLTTDPVSANNTASVRTMVQAPSLIQFAASSLMAMQTDGTATVIVTRSGGLDQAVSVRFAVIGGTAQAGSDYTVVTPQTLTFAPGQTTQSIPVGIINDPNSDSAETVVFGLSGASGNATLGQSTATLTIAGKTVVPTGAGPTVTSLQRFGYHWMPTRLVLTFSEALDPARAQNVNNYVLIAPGRDHRLGTADDQVVGIVSATYDPTTRTVTLAPDRRLYLYDRYVLRVIGTGPGGIADTSGHLLDGAGNGRAGSDYVTTFGREILVFAPSPGRISHFGFAWFDRVKSALAGSGGISNISG